MSRGEQTTQIEATYNIFTFIDSLTSYIIHDSIHETAYTGLTPQRFFINISDTPLNLNISNIIIRDDNNSNNINMLSSNHNIISNVNLNHHNYH